MFSCIEEFSQHNLTNLWLPYLFLIQYLFAQISNFHWELNILRVFFVCLFYMFVWFYSRIELFSMLMLYSVTEPGKVSNPSLLFIIYFLKPN